MPTQNARGMRSNIWDTYRNTFERDRISSPRENTDRESALRIAHSPKRLVDSRHHHPPAIVKSRGNIPLESLFPFALRPRLTEKMANQQLSESSSTKTLSEKDRALFADPEKKSLLSAAEATDNTASIGTTISGVQLQDLTHDQLDELALLVSERGVIFFRGQALDHEGQASIFKHYERLNADTISSGNAIGASNEDQWLRNEWNNARSPVNNSPSYSILRIGDSPKENAETIWVSWYPSVLDRSFG